MNFGLECRRMTEIIRNFAGTLVAASLTFGTAHAQSSNPICPRLEAQLASLDRGNTDPARVEQIRRTEDMVNRQQYEVDRMVAQSRRIGCEMSGFFSIFSNPPTECGRSFGRSVSSATPWSACGTIWSGSTAVPRERAASTQEEY